MTRFGSLCAGGFYFFRQKGSGYGCYLTYCGGCVTDGGTTECRSFRTTTICRSGRQTFCASLFTFSRPSNSISFFAVGLDFGGEAVAGLATGFTTAEAGFCF